MKTLSKSKRFQLRGEYYIHVEKGGDALQWCVEKARYYDMSYGDFVALLKLA
jgi:hypothetical protein